LKLLKVHLRLGAACVLERDHQRDEGPPRTAMDRRDAPCRRGGEAYARRRPILEQQLATLDLVALGDPKGGLEADIVVREQGHGGGRGGRLDHLLGGPRERQVQSLFQAVRMHQAPAFLPAEPQKTAPAPFWYGPGVRLRSSWHGTRGTAE
jgi:hypothetical protein